MRRFGLLTVLAASTLMTSTASAIGPSQDLQINLQATVAEACSIIDVRLVETGPETELLVTAGCNAEQFAIDVQNSLNISVESAQSLSGSSSIAGVSGSSVSVLPTQPGVFEFKFVLSAAPADLTDLNVTLAT